MNSIHLAVKELIEHKTFQKSIMALIILNGIILGFETSPNIMNSAWGRPLHIIDAICLWIFVGELLLGMFVYRTSFFKDPWRIFDTIVVGIALAPGGGSLSVLRGLRVLRVLRLINTVPSLKRIINAVVHAIPGMSAICGLLAILYYVAAVMATKLFGGAFPEWFGTLGESFYTLFQVMTLESWSMGIVRPVMDKFPYAWMFFVPFIIVATFTMLNLFVGVVVGAMQSAALEQESQNSSEEDLSAQILKQLKEIEQKLEALTKSTGSRQQRASND